MAWGHSSAGRALAWHARGRGFEPPWLHQGPLARLDRQVAPGIPQQDEFTEDASPNGVKNGGFDRRQSCKWL
jgi:hypothetical protein